MSFLILRRIYPVLAFSSNPRAQERPVNSGLFPVKMIHIVKDEIETRSVQKKCVMGVLSDNADTSKSL